MKIFVKGFFLSSFFACLIGLLFLAQPALAANDLPSGSTVTDDTTTGYPSGSTVTGDTTTGYPGGSTVTNTGATSTGVTFPTNTGLADPSGGIAEILTTFLSWLLGMFGILALISFVVSGSMYLLAAGNDDMIILIQAIDAALNASSML